MPSSARTPSIALQAGVCNILDGGWKLTYTLDGLDNPETVTLRLVFGDKIDDLQVCGRPLGRNARGGKHLVDLQSGGLAKLQEVLAAIAERETWSSTFGAQIVIKKDAAQYLSNTVQIAAPAKPLDKLSLAAIRNDQHVYYLRDLKHFEGRLITQVGGKYYFAYHGNPARGCRFETDEVNRGMDCTTFVMSIFELRGSLAGIDGYGVYQFFGSAAEQVSYSPYEDPKRQVSRLRVEPNGRFKADKIGGNVVNLLLDDLAETRQLYLFACQTHVFYQLGDTCHEFNTNSGNGQQMVSGYKTGPIRAKFSDARSTKKWSVYRINKSLPL